MARRPLRVSPRTRVVAGVIAAVLIVGFLGQLFCSKHYKTPPPPPSLPTITGNQIYIAQIWHVTLNSMSPSTGASQSVNTGSLLNFENGETIQTDNGNGYAYLGFPGQAQLYLAGGTEIILRDE